MTHADVEQRLRVRLEGAFEALEAMEEACGAGLRLLTELSWRRRLSVQQPELDRVRSAVIASPAALERVTRLEAQASPAERARLKELTARVTKASAKLERRLEEVLAASAAEPGSTLVARLDEVARLAQPPALEPGERVLCSCPAELRPASILQWLASPSEDPAGVLRLTQRRLLYEDDSRRLDVPLAALSLSGGWKVALEFGSQRFGGFVSDVEGIALRLRLLRAFPLNGDAADQGPTSISLATRLSPVTGARPGLLLGWRGGLLFAPDDGARELLRALCPAADADEVFAPATRGLLQSVECLLPWIADEVITRMKASTWDWCWSREECVIVPTQTDGVHLTHRSGDVDLPTYVLSGRTGEWRRTFGELSSTSDSTAK